MFARLHCIYLSIINPVLTEITEFCFGRSLQNKWQLNDYCSPKKNSVDTYALMSSRIGSGCNTLTIRRRSNFFPISPSLRFGILDVRPSGPLERFGIFSAAQKIIGRRWLFIAPFKSGLRSATASHYGINMSFLRRRSKFRFSRRHRLPRPWPFRARPITVETRIFRWNYQIAPVD